MPAPLRSIAPIPEIGPRFNVSISCCSDRGRVRETNEDAMAVDESAGIAVIADGLGGQPAGEIASHLAVQTIAAGLRAARPLLLKYDAQDYEEIAQVIAGIVSIANMRIIQRGNEEPDKEGMSTTLDAVIILGNHAYVAHVGDSRVYWVTGDQAALITEDHTLANMLLETGAIEEANAQAYENILMRSLGSDTDLGVDLHRVEIHDGDRLLLCTDGVWHYFRDTTRIATTIGKNGVRAPELLVRQAIAEGGDDNATAVLMTFRERGSAQTIELSRWIP